MTELDVAYCAGLIDGEAYIGIKKSKAYACQDRQTPGYLARIQIRMVDEGAIKFIAETFGGWYYKEKPHSQRGRPLYCYQASHKAAADLLHRVLPYLRVKREVAETVLALREMQANAQQHRTKITGYREFRNVYGTVRIVANKAYSDEYVAECERLYQHCSELNRVGVEE